MYKRQKKPCPIGNHRRVGTGLPYGIEYLYEGHIALPTKDDTFGWLHTVRGDNREGDVLLNGRALRERQLVEMERTDSIYKSAYDLGNRLVTRSTVHPFLFGFKQERPCFE